MIRFKQFITEVFNKPLPFTMVMHHDTDSEYEFHIPNEDRVVSVEIQKTPGRLSPMSDRFYVVFSINTDSGFTYSMTNENKYQVLIMSTVVDIIRKHFKDFPLKQHDYIEFDSKIKDRGRLAVYKRLAKGLATELDAKVVEFDNYGTIAFAVKKL